MMEMNPLKRHYFLSLIPTLIFVIASLFAGLKLLWISFFLLGFLWIWGPFTPGLLEKVRTPKYKFSFFRLMYWMIGLAEDQLFFAPAKLVKTISRVFSGMVFCMLISFLSDSIIVLTNLLGLAVGELWLLFNKKYYPDSYEKSEPNLSENSL